nr:MAG TPA: hypothetical protein [Caudoviricetes sp.]
MPQLTDSDTSAASMRTPWRPLRGCYPLYSAGICCQSIDNRGFRQGTPYYLGVICFTLNPRFLNFILKYTPFSYLSYLHRQNPNL